jgi:hypothetical protein
MKEIAISKFKATCLAVLERVRKTGEPILELPRTAQNKFRGEPRTDQSKERSLSIRGKRLGGDRPSREKENSVQERFKTALVGTALPLLCGWSLLELREIGKHFRAVFFGVHV